MCFLTDSCKIEISLGVFLCSHRLMGASAVFMETE